MKRVGILGATGRVGLRLIENLKNDKELKISVLHAIDKFSIPISEEILVTNDIDTLIDNADVIIDFSLPEGTEELIKKSIDSANPKPIVSGTTGLSSHQLNLLKVASQDMPILYATNMSLGIALLNRLVELSSKVLNDFDVEIVEQHHRYKKDAPSGTALTLAEYVAKARDLDLNRVRVSGRNGDIGARTKDEIGVMAIRGGDVVGRHTVGFYNDGEFLELNHTATSRDTFAKGAIKSAKWLVNQKNGLYSIKDCLGL